ncbi:hypothetical protein BDW62DRAFT_187109 [Aspergillus aurantiobrunneus]
MRFRLPYTHDELPVDENNRQPANTEFLTGKGRESRPADVISSLASGLIKLPYAKLMDIWGRPQDFALMVGSMTMGLIMMAGCKNVETYCAAQVFYQIGYTGISVYPPLPDCPWYPAYLYISRHCK